MAEKAFTMRKAIPIIVITWILSLVTTLGVVYVSPSIFPPLKTAHISDEAIITTKLADGSVNSAKIIDGEITASDLADGSIITVKIADGTIMTSKLADDAVTSEKLADSAIITVKLADGVVTSAKILNGAVLAEDLATGAVTAMKISDGAVTTTKIADYAVTNLKLASSAIPFASTYNTLDTSTTETVNWVDMTGMSVTLTLSRTSHVLIMFSTEAYNTDAYERTIVRAVVGTEEAYPGDIWMTPPILETSLHTHLHGWAAYSYNFYRPSMSSGTHTIKIQWMVTGGTGNAGFRTLTVIALPA